VTIRSAQQTLENRSWYQGTADAVRQNLKFVEKMGDLVLILSGDHLYRMDYRNFVESHLQRNADISISVIPVPAARAPEYGVMKVNALGRIVDFHEKPKEIMDIERLKVPEDIFERFVARAAGKTHLASMGIYLFDSGVLADLLGSTAHEDFGREVIDEEHPIFTHARFLPGSKILASDVENSILCEGSIVNGIIVVPKNAVIPRGTVI
jgi:glucose-1-phosphate adenylyltransferase